MLHQFNSNDFGVIEWISNFALKQNMKNEHFKQLITSAAASYIGSFVCGVRDRHFENILIRVADQTIKFALDASPFGITYQLKDLMNYGNQNENYDLYNWFPMYKDKIRIFIKYMVLNGREFFVQMWCKWKSGYNTS